MSVPSKLQVGLVTALLCVGAAAEVKAEDTGLYVGLQAGYGAATFEQNRTSTAGGASSWSSDLGGNGFVGGLFGGYGRTFGSFYLGGEGTVEYGKIEGNFSDQANYNRTISLEETYSLSMRPGYFLTPQTLAYGRVGWAASKFKVSQDATGAAPMPQTDEWVNGIVAGFGLEQEVAKSLALRLDYRHTFYYEEPTNSNTAGTRTDKYSIDSDIISVGVLYKF